MSSTSDLYSEAFKSRENQPVNFPAIQQLIWIRAQKRRRRRRKLLVNHFLVTSPPDDDTSMTVSRKQHAKSPWIEMKSIRLRKARQWVPNDHHVVFESLELVG